MKTIRLPAVSGAFYPDSADELRVLVGALLDDALGEVGDLKDNVGDVVPKAIIAPHAGYVYSGPIAAVVYSVLRQFPGRWNRVAVIGPAHFVYLRGLALSSADAFRTPLGDVSVDPQIVQRLLKLDYVSVNEEAHAQEHSIEVHLPFLQTVLGKFSLVPILVGDARDSEIADVLKLLFEQDDLLVVVSSDLSHYLDYETAQSLDRKTSSAIEMLKVDEIQTKQACGAKPIRGLLHYAKEHKLSARNLILANSGDTAGDKKRVVGYGAYVFV